MPGPVGNALLPSHGGTDAAGAAPHDFSTNSNACGPCPEALQAVQSADATRYPDPSYAALRGALGAFHGVSAQRIVLAGSASEFIHRITAWVAGEGGEDVSVPLHSYGDYGHAAQSRRLALVRRTAEGDGAAAALQWACEPSSPHGRFDPALARWSGEGGISPAVQVLDCAYLPLRLEGGGTCPPAQAWQLWTPNKALGLTGVRAAYAIAPAHEPLKRIQALQALAPSWCTGAHGVALLSAWVLPSVQQWLWASLATLRDWKAAQLALCASLGWQVLPGSLANYFVARVPVHDLSHTLQALRAHGIKLRDCATFGLPCHVRLGVLAPASQKYLQQVLRQLGPPTVRRATATMPPPFTPL
jgi:histidinol-phosphate aminotransferase